jgi:GNAT superfamily N-acetyltransferase
MAKPRATPPRQGSLTKATEVFVHGFAFTRSFTHPCLGERVGPLWVVRDAPRVKAADYRREEWIATGTAPVAVDRLARANTRGRFVICAIVPAGTDDGPLRAAYKALGYRLAGTEAFMVHDLKTIPRVTSPAAVTRVLSPELAKALAKAAGRRQIQEEQLHPGAPLRAYAAEREGRVVGWVRSVDCAAGTWCADMFVLPPHRRQGIASALLAAMLRDDRQRGAKQAVLLASQAGAKLYVTLGFRLIGTLWQFIPRR